MKTRTVTLLSACFLLLAACGAGDTSGSTEEVGEVDASRFVGHWPLVGWDTTVEDEGGQQVAAFDEGQSGEWSGHLDLRDDGTFDVVWDAGDNSMPDGGTWGIDEGGVRFQSEVPPTNPQISNLRRSVERDGEMLLHMVTFDIDTGNGVMTYRNVLRHALTPAE